MNLPVYTLRMKISLNPATTNFLLLVCGMLQTAETVSNGSLATRIHFVLCVFQSYNEFAYTNVVRRRLTPA